MLQSLPDDHILQSLFRCWQILLQKCVEGCREQ